MISDSATHIVRRARHTAHLAVMLVGISMPLSAQDSKSGDCPAIREAGIEDCVASEPVATEPVPQAYPFDWVPIESVPAELRDHACKICGGRYIDPLADEDRSVDPDDADIQAWTASTELTEEIVTFDGGVEVAQGYRRFRGENAVIDRTQARATLTGAVILREPGILLQGRRAEIYTETGEATVDEGHFVLHPEHLRGTADKMERDADGLIHIHQGTFSYCPPGEHAWDIQASDVELDVEEGLGTAHNARVNIAGVPVFYTPWLQFPLDDRRRTGLLWPDFGNDSTGGLDITAPVYFNLAPNYDALYSPRYIEERGFNHELKLRYLHKYLGHWTVGGTYMADDDRYEKEVPPWRSNDRWLGVVRQNGLIRQRWRSRVDYSKVSDVDYMKDLEASSLDAQRRTSLLQLGSADYLGDNWLLNLEVQKFQSLADDITNTYQKLPQFTAQYRGSGTPFEFEPILLAQYSHFESDENVVTGQRMYAEVGATYPMQWIQGFIKPMLKYRQLNYELSDGGLFADDNPSAGSALASVDGGLFFERQTVIANKSLFQTLEPRLYYLYSDYEDQDDQPDFDSAELTFQYNQLFRETRFSGHDRLDDANQLSIGLTTRFIDAESGQTLFSASLGQIYYFRDRRVRLLPGASPLDDSGSEISAELNFTPNRHLSLRSSLVYDRYSGKMNSGNVQASYTRDDGMIFNIGYAYRRPLTLARLQPETEQANISAYYPLNEKWRIFGAINYSVVDNRSIEDMFGVEYDNCCWKVRLLHLRYYDNETTGFFPDFSNPDLERENSTQVQIILKGMGGFGDRITSILEDLIRGYQESEY